jgi:branched-chain amino acid transport system permease protein
MGISGIPPLGVGRFTITSDRALLIWLVAFAAIGVLAAAGIRHSRLGRAFVAIAGSEDAARALGIDVARYKLVAFLISALYAAVAGSLFVHAVGFVSPEVYGLHMVVLAFTMLYVGGIGTVAGAALGALVIALLPETVRRFSEYQDLAYGALLILILIYAPGGLASLSRMWSRKPAREDA